MKTTLDIPNELFIDAMKSIDVHTKKEVVMYSLNEVIRRKKMADLAQKLGTFNDFISHHELMKLRTAP